MTTTTVELLSLKEAEESKTDKLKKDFIKLSKANTRNIVEMGKMLIVIKERLGHGQYAHWLDVQCNFSQSTANKYVKLVNEYLDLDSELIPNLGIAKALLLIKISKADRLDYIESNDIYNKSVSEVKALMYSNTTVDTNKDDITNIINKNISKFNDSLTSSLKSNIKLLEDNHIILNEQHKLILSKYKEIEILIAEVGA